MQLNSSPEEEEVVRTTFAKEPSTVASVDSLIALQESHERMKERMMSLKAENQRLLEEQRAARSLRPPLAPGPPPASSPKKSGSARGRRHQEMCPSRRREIGRCGSVRSDGQGSQSGSNSRRTLSTSPDGLGSARSGRSTPRFESDTIASPRSERPRQTPPHPQTRSGQVTPVQPTLSGRNTPRSSPLSSPVRDVYAGCWARSTHPRIRAPDAPCQGRVLRGSITPRPPSVVTACASASGLLSPQSPQHGGPSWLHVPRRSRSWTPPRRCDSPEPEGLTLGADCAPSVTSSGSDLEAVLPRGWRRLVTHAYRQASGRQYVDRVRLLECSTAAGRQENAEVFWLHTAVRWAELDVGAESGHVVDRGEDLTLFVIHCQLPREQGHGAMLLGGRPWTVAAVRILNNLPFESEAPGKTSLRARAGGALLRFLLQEPGARTYGSGSILCMPAPMATPKLASPVGTPIVPPALLWPARGH